MKYPQKVRVSPSLWKIHFWKNNRRGQINPPSSLFRFKEHVKIVKIYMVKFNVTILNKPKIIKFS